MGVYFFWGNEEYLISKELQNYRNKLDSTFSEMNYEVHSQLTYPDFISILRSQPMMFGKKMIIIDTHKLFKTGNKYESLFSVSLEDYQLEEIESALTGNSENEMLDIFLVEKYEKNDKKKKPDTRKKIFKILSKFNNKEFPAIPTYKTAELTNIINQMAKERKIKIEPKAAELLIGCKENDLRAYETELDKLQLFAYPETIITSKMVEEICTSNADILKLLDYVLKQENGLALLELRKILETEYPLKILATLQTSLKKWIYIKLNSKKMNFKEIGAKVDLHEYVVKLTLEKMKNTSAKTLVDLKKSLTEAEYKIKTGQSYKPEEELENVIIG